MEAGAVAAACAPHGWIVAASGLPLRWLPRLGLSRPRTLPGRFWEATQLPVPLLPLLLLPLTTLGASPSPPPWQPKDEPQPCERAGGPCLATARACAASSRRAMRELKAARVPLAASTHASRSSRSSECAHSHVHASNSCAASTSAGGCGPAGPWPWPGPAAPERP